MRRLLPRVAPFFGCVLVLAACGARPPARETPSSDRDQDADTVRDLHDACPLHPEDLDGRSDDDGCPDLDDDGDGIADVHDRCPCHVEDRDEWQDEDGCPELDDDQDRIVDACDLCRNEPETYNGGCDEDGCPDRGRVCVAESRIAIVQHVYFRRGRAEITPPSFALVDAIAQTMIGNPQITLVAIVGQAEPSELRREDLALRRAEALLEALVARGLPRERLVAEAGTGAGVEGLPRDQQRRVELFVRAIDGVALPVVPEGAPEPEPESACGEPTPPCRPLPVCDPAPPSPVC